MRNLQSIIRAVAALISRRATFDMRDISFDVDTADVDRDLSFGRS
ncbi:MAG TPA: hypothetical protein PKJ99_02780 [Thermoanaerobaculales bacterium]|nr:hypothetical protein [Thermoanaerobaculales bacterium]HPA80255.1 hypothetical protein [Thermoanaerobaculales bacterium]HQL29836.1 hypothetical protein [Thermoanaerobaculales bacterium]HQN95498.1 hypothetical protein [Thermoanaerobaculales bacterium]HQP44540.1 hypothetical protein [Thermoanaerobaculales bacterium]